MTEIIRTISNQVRILETDIAAQTWFQHSKNPRAAANRAIGRLVREGYATAWPAMIPRSIDVTEPLFAWFPGRDTPPSDSQFEQLAWLNQKRWTAPLGSTVCFMATAKAHHQFGGVPRPIRPRELAHDVLVAKLYLHLLRSRPEQAGQWLHEDQLAPGRFGGKVPDAIVQENPQTVIEVVGSSYDANKLRTVFEHFKHERLQFR